MLRINLLGGCQLEYHGEIVTAVDTPRLQELLAYLLINRDLPQSRQHLAFSLWPDTDEQQARTNLRNLLYHLRRTLPDADQYLSIERHNIRWRNDAPFRLDVIEFNNALQQAAAAKDSAAQKLALEQAIANYGGELLPGCYAEWILLDREHLEQTYHLAMYQLAELLENQQEYDDAIKLVKRMTRREPLDENRHGDLIRLHLLKGDRAGALRSYHICTEQLQTHLNVQPGPSIQELYERILHYEEQSHIALNDTHLFTTPLLIGREEEWASLQQIWARTKKGQPQIVLITGQAGVGKTRLAEELLMWIGRQGILTARASCFPSQGILAYAPVMEWLRNDDIQTHLSNLDHIWLTEISRLLPEILATNSDIEPPGPMTEDWQRTRFFEALTHAILSTHEPRPRVLLIDDLQWCDAETIALIHYLLHSDATAPLLVIGTYRLENIDPEHKLHSLLLTLRQADNLHEFMLNPLSQDDTYSLSRALIQHDLKPTTLQHLFESTEGNPLFIVEMIRAGLDETSLIDSSDAEMPIASTLPPAVQAVIETRLRQLSKPAQEIVTLAAVIGREFDYEVLREVSQQNEDDVLLALDELWQRQIIREKGINSYDFSHGKLRDVAYQFLTAPRRTRLHQNVADTLQVLYQHKLDEVSGMIAGHYAQAGKLEEAVHFYRHAVEASLSVFANNEAVNYLKQILELVSTSMASQFNPLELTHTQTETGEKLGDVYATRMSLYPEAKDAYLQALKHGTSTNDVFIHARLLRKIGNAWRLMRTDNEAFDSYIEAQEMLESGEEAITKTSAWWREWIEIQLGRTWLHYNRGETDELEAIIKSLPPLVEAYGTPTQIVQLYQALVNYACRRDRYLIDETTVGYAQSALRASLQTNDRNTVAFARFTAAFALLWHGEHEKAEQYLHESLKSAEETGYLYLQILCHTYLSIINRRQLMLDDCDRHTSRAFDLSVQLKRQRYLGAAHANFAWIAYKNEQLNKIEEHGLQALGLWETAYPFKWLALWPLLHLEVSRSNIANAVDYAQQLLGSYQQLMPSVLENKLQAAIQFFTDEATEQVLITLEEALNSASTMNYL